MASFPSSPTNGDLVTLNGITYSYNSTKTAWVRQSLAIADLTLSGTLLSNQIQVATGLFWSSNSVPYGDTLAGGNTGQLQFNSSGDFFGANINFTSANGNLVISSVTSSTTTDTGALVVEGGVGVGGTVTADKLTAIQGIFWPNGAPYSGSATTSKSIAMSIVFGG